jgi:hypothetical protein
VGFAVGGQFGFDLGAGFRLHRRQADAWVRVLLTVAQFAAGDGGRVSAFTSARVLVETKLVLPEYSPNSCADTAAEANRAAADRAMAMVFMVRLL